MTAFSCFGVCRSWAILAVFSGRTLNSVRFILAFHPDVVFRRGTLSRSQFLFVFPQPLFFFKEAIYENHSLVTFACFICCVRRWPPWRTCSPSFCPSPVENCRSHGGWQIPLSGQRQSHLLLLGRRLWQRSLRLWPDHICRRHLLSARGRSVVAFGSRRDWQCCRRGKDGHLFRRQWQPGR